MELLERFTQLYEEGRPLVATIDAVQVIDNPFYGTTSSLPDGTGNKVSLTVFYYSLPGANGSYHGTGSYQEWDDATEYVEGTPGHRPVPPKPSQSRHSHTRAWGEGSWAAQVGKEILSNDRYNTFPHLKIAGQNLSACDGCKIDAYTPGQVNLFGYLGDYMVADHWEETLSKLFVEGRRGEGLRAEGS